MVETVISISVFLVFQAIGAVIWGVRQEGKINLQEQRTTDLKELINSRFDDTDKRLERIERGVNGKKSS